MRAQAAADAVTKQKDAVEKSREYELSRVKTQGGKTRLDLEKDIKDLQDEIFKIEEEKLEPAQEFIRLRQIVLDKDIEGLTVLGLTKDAWEAIKNQVDLALIKSAAFVDSMKLALDIQAKLIAAYQAQPGNTSSNSAAQGPSPIISKPYVPDPEASPEANKEAEDAHKAAADAEAEANAALSEATAAALAAAAAIAELESQSAEIGKVAAGISALAIRKATNTTSLNKAVALAEGNLSPESIAINMSRALLSSKTMTKSLGGTAGALSTARYTGQAMKSMGLSAGGMVPKMFAAGGFAKGTDTVPAMLTPGEFIMSKYAVDSYGVDHMKKMNNGDLVSGAVYNNTYTLTVNAKTNANPNEIAQAVMSTIKQVDDRRIRGVSLNARN